MDLVAQSQTRLTILMVLGAVFAAAGLWLLIRPKPATGAAKIELFGLKFEASSAGILVFLIGAAFLAVPLFVKERTMQVVGTLPGVSPEEPGTSGQTGGTNTALVLPDSPGASEVEPNDRVQKANQLAIGATVEGKTRDEQVDWYVVPTAGQEGKRLVVILRRTAGPQVYGDIMDANEQRIDQMGWASAGAAMGEADITGPKIYLRIVGDYIDNAMTTYEIVTRVEEP